MASAKEDLDSRHVIQCGNCMEVDGYLLNPVVLPCGHKFCEKCLRDHHPKMKIFTCFRCKEKTDIPIENLPSALADLKTFCDTCTKKGKKCMTAKGYCIQCDRKFCAEHIEWHDDGIDNHDFLAIRDYLDSSFAEEQRFCKTHKGQVVNIGCRECFIICCPGCLATEKTCIDGSPHDFTSLKDVAAKVKQATEPLKQKVEDRFDEVSALIKEITIVLSEWDIGTEEGVRFLHHTRDEQVNAVISNYKTLEEEYVASRTKAKSTITDYLAKEGGLRLTEFLTQLKKLRTMISYKHPIDLITERVDVKAAVEKLIQDEFPSLCLESQSKIVSKGLEYRDTELVIQNTEGITFDIEHHFEVKLPPKTLKFIKKIAMNNRANCVCRYKNVTYVGVYEKGIVAVDTAGHQSLLAKEYFNFAAMKINDARIYGLINNHSGYEICIYNLQGQRLSQWKVSDGGTTWPGCRVCFDGDELAVADRRNQRITMYDLSGHIIRHVECPAMTEGGKVIICEAEQHHVIISDQSSSTVSKLNLMSGEVKWSSQHVPEPQAVKFTPSGYVLVASMKEKLSISILDYKSGELVADHETDQDDAARNYDVYDMCLEDNTLMIPLFDESGHVLFYALE